MAAFWKVKETDDKSMVNMEHVDVEVEIGMKASKLEPIGLVPNIITVPVLRNTCALKVGTELFVYQKSVHHARTQDTPIGVEIRDAPDEPPAKKGRKGGKGKKGR